MCGVMDVAYGLMMRSIRLRSVGRGPSASSARRSRSWRGADTRQVYTPWQRPLRVASRRMSEALRVHVGPKVNDAVLRAVREGGGEPAGAAEAEAIVWLDHDPSA